MAHAAAAAGGSHTSAVSFLTTQKITSPSHRNNTHPVRHTQLISEDLYRSRPKAQISQFLAELTAADVEHTGFLPAHTIYRIAAPFQEVFITEQWKMLAKPLEGSHLLKYAQIVRLLTTPAFPSAPAPSPARRPAPSIRKERAHRSLHPAAATTALASATNGTAASAADTTRRARKHGKQHGKHKHSRSGSVSPVKDNVALGGTSNGHTLSEGNPSSSNHNGAAHSALSLPPSSSSLTASNPSNASLAPPPPPLGLSLPQPEAKSLDTSPSPAALSSSLPLHFASAAASKTNPTVTSSSTSIHTSTNHPVLLSSSSATLHSASKSSHDAESAGDEKSTGSVAAVVARFRPALLHHRGVLRARWQSIDRSKSGLLSAAAFRAILQSSLGALSDHEFRHLAASPAQISLPAYVDYNVFLDNLDTAGVDTTAPLRAALMWLCTLPAGDFQAMAAQDGSVSDTSLRSLLSSGGHVLSDHLFASVLAHLGFMHTYPSSAPSVYGKRCTVPPSTLVEKLGALRAILSKNSPVDLSSLSSLSTADALSSSGRMTTVRFHPSVGSATDSGNGTSDRSHGAKAHGGAIGIHVPTAGGDVVEAEKLEWEEGRGGGSVSPDGTDAGVHGGSGGGGVGAAAAALSDGGAVGGVVDAAGLGSTTKESAAALVCGKLSKSAPIVLPAQSSLKRNPHASTGPVAAPPPPLDPQEEGRRIRKLLRMGQVGGLAEMLFEVLPPEPLNGATIIPTVTKMLQDKFPAVMAAMLERDYLQTGFLSRQDLRRVLESFTSPFSDVGFVALCRHACIMKDGSVAYEQFLRVLYPQGRMLMATATTAPLLHATSLTPVPVPAKSEIPRRHHGALGNVHAAVRGPVLENIQRLKELFASADPSGTEEVPAAIFSDTLAAVGVKIARGDMDALCMRWRGVSPLNVNYARFLLYLAPNSKKV